MHFLGCFTLLGFISPETSNSRQIVGTFGHKEGNQSLWPTAIKPTQTKQPILRFCVGWGSSFITGLVFLLPPKWPFHRLQKARLDSLISFTAPQLTDGPQTPLWCSHSKGTVFHHVSSHFGGTSPRFGTGQPAEGTLCVKPLRRTGFHLHVKSFHSIPRRALIL